MTARRQIRCNPRHEGDASGPRASVAANWRSKLNVRWFAHRTANPLKIEAPPCHFAGVISGQTSSANIRSYGVDRACRRDAYVSHKRCTAITVASHASMFAIGIRAGDLIEIGVTFQ
jgi:hypothetical protein